jgi:adenylate cyclase
MYFYDMKRHLLPYFFYCYCFVGFCLPMQGQTLDSAARASMIIETLEQANTQSYEKAHQTIDPKQQRFQQQKQPFDQAYTLYAKSILFIEEQKWDEAIQSLQQSLELYEKSSNKPKYVPKQLALICSKMGNVYSSKNDYANAIDCYQKALKIHEKNKNSESLAELYVDMAYLYRDIRMYNEAIEYAKKALDLHQKLAKSDFISYDLQTLGILYDETQHYDQALDYYFKTLESKVKDSVAIYNNIATSFKNKKDYDQALTFAQRAQQLSLEKGDFTYMSIIEATLCEIFFIKKQNNEALRHGLNSIRIAREDNDIATIKEVAFVLKEIYDQKGDKSLAYGYFQEHIAARDSLNNENKDREITQKIAQFSFDVQQEKKDAVAATEKKILYGGLATLGLLAALIFINFRRERKAKAEIAIEQQKSEELLLNILPKHVADELKTKGKAEARSYEQVSVLFSDFKDFTKVSEQVTPAALVELINTYFTEFDKIIVKHNLEKIKTIGDAYVCAAGLRDEDTTDAAVRLVKAAIEIQALTQTIKIQAISEHKPYFEQRVGISTGAIVAGIVGLKKFTYDIWGDTVNVAARMEQSSEAGKINISESTYQLIKTEFDCIYRGKIDAKNKGEINMYFVKLDA